METAFQLFTSKGIVKTSISDIAEQAGYKSFASSDDRLLAIIDDILFQLQKKTEFLRFVNKDPSWRVFRQILTQS